MAKLHSVLAGAALAAAVLTGSAVPLGVAPSRSDVPGPPSTSVPVGQSSLPGLTTHVDRSCSGTGTDGLRVEAVYAVELGSVNRYTESVPTILNELANVDDTFAASAAKTGGGRRVRWVFTPDTCVPAVAQVVLPAGALSGGASDAASFAGAKAALISAGLTDPSRRYLVFADSTRLCGLADLFGASSPTADETAQGPLFARVDSPCWQMQEGWHSIAAHELMHTLGAVQPGAPHAAGGHCSDESDAMCYDDQSAPVVITHPCPAADEALYDCGNDDYFNSAPPAGSYLATHWNTADSQFLDKVVSIGPPPTVSVAGPVSVRPGLPAILTATSSDPVGTWSWTVSPAGCAVGSTTSPSLTIQCPTSGYTTTNGQVTATATFQRPDGRAGEDSHAVTIGVASSLPLTNNLSAAPTYLFFGQTTRLTATVMSGSTPVRAVAKILSSTDGVHWTTVAGPLDIGTDGSLSIAARPSLSTLYQLATYVVGGTGWTQTNRIIEVPVYKASTRFGMAGTAGRPDVMKGRLINANTGVVIPNTTVTLQYRYYGSSTWRTWTTRVTSTTGYAVAGVQPKRRTYFRWYFGGSSAYYVGSASAAAYVTY